MLHLPTIPALQEKSSWNEFVSLLFEGCKTRSTTLLVSSQICIYRSHGVPKKDAQQCSFGPVLVICLRRRPQVLQKTSRKTRFHASGDEGDAAKDVRMEQDASSLQVT